MDDLLELHGINLGLGLALEESSIKAKVSGGTSGSLQHLLNSNGVKDLKQTEPEEHLGHASLLNGSIVSSDGSQGLKSLSGRVDTEAQIDGNESQPGHHADASVLELGLAKEIDGDEVRETEGIKSQVSNTSIEVWWGLKEGEGGRFLGQRGDGTCCVAIRRKYDIVSSSV